MISPGADIDLRLARVLSASAARSLTELRADRMVFAVERGATVRIDHPAACPSELTPTQRQSLSLQMAASR